MAVSKMKKLSVFASRKDLNAVIAELMELRCVEVAEALPEDLAAPLDGGALPVEKSETERRIASIREALALTHKYAKDVKSLRPICGVLTTRPNTARPARCSQTCLRRDKD